MTYPKPLMTITEMLPLGFTRDELNKAVHSEGQNFAHKQSERGKWKIDTEKFEVWRTRK